MPTTDLTAAITETPARSAWERGVRQYAVELIEGLSYLTADEWDGSWQMRLRLLLNGAADWHQYSYGGCSLIYDAEIAERLCPPSELARSRDGDRPPNSCETWLDCQARALHQAAELIRCTHYGLSGWDRVR